MSPQVLEETDMQSDLNVKPFITIGAYAAKTLVYLSAAGTVTALTDGTKPPLGVLQSPSTASKLIADVAIPRSGQFVEVTAGDTNTAGKLAIAMAGGLTDDHTTDNVWALGTFMNAGSAGSTVTLLWNPHVTNDVSTLGGN
jgi:hypothetical protein